MQEFTKEQLEAQAEATKLKLTGMPPEPLPSRDNPHGLTPKQLAIAEAYKRLNRKQKRKVKAEAMKARRKELHDAARKAGKR